MSEMLERDYRRALRWYPASWRKANGDAILGTLLDVAEGEGRNRLLRSERVDFALSGIEAWLNLFVSARVRDGVAAVALVTGAVFTLALGVLGYGNVLYGSASLVLGFPIATLLLFFPWACALVSALFGWHKVVKIFAVLAVGAALLIRLGHYYGARTPGEWEWSWAVNSNVTTLFVSVLAVFVLFGVPRSRSRLALGFGLSVATFGALCFVMTVLVWQGHFGTEDASIWGNMVYSVPARIGVLLYLALPLVLCSVLYFTGRATGAAIAAISCVPWLLTLWVARTAVLGDLRSTAISLAIAGVVALPVLVILFIARRAGFRIVLTRDRFGRRRSAASGDPKSE